MAGESALGGAAAAAPAAGGDGGGSGGGNPAAAAPAAGAPAAAANGGVAQVVIPDNWKDSITDEEVRKEASLESIKTVGDLAKSYVHAQKQFGKDKVVIPDAKFATDADWKAFYGKLGMPADSKDYKIELPKGMKIDETFLTEFGQAAHAMNILPGQASKLMEWYEKKDQQIGEQVRAKQMADINTNLNAYKAQQGKAFEKKVMYANKVIAELGGPEFDKMISSNPALGNNPTIIETLAKIGEKLFSEDTFDGKDRVVGAMSPGDATARINEIMKDTTHPYWIADHPKHKESVDHVQKLFEFQNP